MSVQTGLLWIRIVLAGVLLVAALAKLANRSATREMLGAFGIPGLAVAPGVLLLPLAEAGAAVLLLPAATAPAAALAALVLLAAFTGAVGFQLARGRRPACNCFGGVHATPIGAWTLVRNCVLLGLAGLLVVVGQTSPVASGVAWLDGPSTVALTGLVLLALVQAVAFVHLLRRHGRLLIRFDALVNEEEPEPTHGLPLGSKAPEFLLPDVHGTPRTLASLRTGARPVLLLFSNPACGPCTALLPDVSRWQRDHDDELLVALVTAGDASVGRAHAFEHELEAVLLAPDHALALSYGAVGTPMAVLVDAEGRIASELATGAGEITALVDATLGAREQVPAHA